MKSSKLINSFRAGLMGLFMRSRPDLKETTNACEELDNFHIRPTGGADRRLGLELRDLHKKDGTKSYKLDTTASQSFVFNIEGEDYYFIFDTTVGFASMDIRPLQSDILNAPYDTTIGTSNFLRIFNLAGEEQRVLVAGNTDSGVPFDFGGVNLTSYLNSRAAQNPIAIGKINQTQLSEKTVIFCDSEGGHFPFYVTRDNFPNLYHGTNVSYAKTFILAPWFYQYSFMQDSYSQTTYKVPVSPLTYPYSLPNTNNAYKVIVAAGATNPAAGLRYDNTQSYDCLVAIPRLLLNYDVVSQRSLGMMVRVTSTVAKEGTFLLTEYNSHNATHVYFKAITSVYGGAYDGAGTSFFQLSAWSDHVGHPKCVNVYRGTMAFAHAGNDRNVMWFAGASSQSLRNFQAMMQTNLLQDVATDASGLLFYDSALKPDRGFDIGLNEGKTGGIKWMYSRRNMHLGTDDGEHQLSFAKYPSGVSGEFNIIKIGSNKSVNVQPTEGDRKIFYVADEGYTIRIISTENKDYDSLDSDLTNFIDVPYPIIKLAWCEKLRVLFALSQYNLFSFTVDQLNDTLAPANVVLTENYSGLLTLKDIMCNKDGYKIVGELSGEYFILESFYKYNYNFDFVYARATHLDFSKSFSNLSSSPTLLGDYFEQFKGKDMVMYKGNQAVGDTFTVPIGYVAGDALTFLPVVLDDSEYSFGLKYSSKLVTFPIEDGNKYGVAQGDVKRIDRATIMVYKSGKCRAGNPDSSIYDVETLSNTAYKTDNIKLDFPDSPDTIVKAQIETDEPAPLTILGVAFRLVDYEGE